MPLSRTLLAVLLYVLPVALVLVVRSSRDRPAWEMALDVPMAVAFDILLVFGFARFVTVEIATLATRPLWIALGAMWWGARQRRRDPPIAWPRVLGPWQVAGIAAAVVLAVVLSLQLSRPQMIWDREWHVPLVASLRGQTLPFQNVFEPGRVLRYHVTGNVLAAELQALSFDVFNGAYALSLAHDVLFALTAASVALAMIHFGQRRRPAVVVLGVLAILLVGPFTLRGNFGTPYVGFSY